MAALEMHCKKCKVASTCPAFGASPLALENGRKMVFCRLLEGYASKPIDDAALSEESRKTRDKNGPCLSFAEVPRLDTASGKTYTEVVKIFHHPILHPRQTTSEVMDRIIPPSHAVQKPPQR
jgi:hypothetical protein